MKRPFDLTNVGRINRFYSQDEASVIRGVMDERKEALGLIKRKMKQLEEEAEAMEGDIVRFGAALLPQKHNLLPVEILSRIFTLVAQDYGTVAFPIFRNLFGRRLPQLTVSHVCSHWRMVAFRTSELWSNTSLHYPKDSDDLWHVHIHQRWLMRAGTFPVTLSITFDEYWLTRQIACALKKILLPFHVKRLHLHITYEQFMALSTFSETPLSRVTEVGLTLTIQGGDRFIDMSSTHHFVTRLRSVTVEGDSEEIPFCLNKLSPSLPWSQLQCLQICTEIEDLHPIVGVLRQMPMLRNLRLRIPRTQVNAPEDVTTVSSLQDFTLIEADDEEVDSTVDLDKILRSFAFPSLLKLRLHTDGFWTAETFEIIKRQYNFQCLQDVVFMGGFALPLSSVLCKLPMLRSLSFDRDAIFDDEAIMGISNGTLGQYLKTLDIITAYDRDAEEVIGMVEARKKTVDALIENGCTWQEEIALLNYISICGVYNEDKYVGRVEALEAAGIKVLFV